MLQIRRAVYRLAVAIGNQAEAETWLGDQPTPRLTNVISDEEVADREELDRAAKRQHAHPQLAATLAVIEAKIREIRKAK